MWESTLQGSTSFGAYGPRDVLIIASSESLEGPDIIPRKKGQLTQEDKESLSSQGIPEECWEDDARLVEGRYRRDGSRFDQITSMGGKESLTCHCVKERIGTVMKTTAKPGGKMS